MHPSLFNLCQNKVSSQLGNTEGADARPELWDWLSCCQRCGPDPVQYQASTCYHLYHFFWSYIIQHSDKEKNGQQKYLMNGGAEDRG